MALDLMELYQLAKDSEVKKRHTEWQFWTVKAVIEGTQSEDYYSQICPSCNRERGTHGWKGSESNEVCSVQKVFDIWAGLSYKSLLSIDLNGISAKCVEDLRIKTDKLNAEMGREVVMFRIKDDTYCWSGKILEIGIRTVDFSVNCITDNFKLDYTSQHR
jgi:predicted choloylglycine hydrolase